MKKIKTEIMEINKPSELTQTMFFKNDDSNAIASLTATQMDMLNLIFYKSKEYFIKEKVEILEFIPFEIDLKMISETFDKYNTGAYTDLIKQLVELSDIKVVINVLGKNKDMNTTFTRFIHKITVSKHKNNNRKKVRLILDGDICKMIFNVKKLFSKFYLKIQFSMKSKYSKLLYELLKDYEGIFTKIIDYELLVGLLNVDYEKTNNGKWALFNQNILKKAVKEINEKSDIKVSYEPIKERPDGGRLQVTKIKFMMEKQDENRLKELGILDQEPELSIEEQIHQNKLKNKSKAKMVKLVKNGYEIKDEESWINTDIRKNEELYTAQYKLDDYIDALDDMDLDSKQELLSSLATYLKTDDPIVLIDGYSIKDLSGNFLTTSAIETRKVILDFQEVSGSN